MTIGQADGWDNSRSAAGDRNSWLIATVVSIATFMQVLEYVDRQRGAAPERGQPRSWRG